MSKTRIHSVSKQLGVDKKEIIDLLIHVGSKPKNHMNTLEDNELDIVFDYFIKKYGEQKELPDQIESQEASSDKTVKGKTKKSKTTFSKTVNSHSPHNNIEGEVEHHDDKGALHKASQEENDMDLEPFQANDGVKKTRLVDTRTDTIDLQKFDTEKIEELIPENVAQQVAVKQKIKKGANRFSAKNTKNIHPEQLAVKSNKEVRSQQHITIGEEISVGDFAEKIGEPASNVIKSLMQLGIMASVSQCIDFETAALIGTDFNTVVEREVVVTDEDLLINDYEDDPESLVMRPPVVVVMGHVDHGKTSLLDAIRKTNVIASEFGGITQHIGAHTVSIHGKDITFLDTPGHEAFTAMRARGAQVTDIAILVVAADDGVMPQTVEAINHAKAAGISIMVAINKIDKDGANPERVKQELTEYDLVPEEWGGDTVCVNVSAKQNQNIDSLLEMIILLAEMRELKANPNRPAKGTIIEAKLDKNRGPVANALVQNGTLNVGDIVIAGNTVGRVRAMHDSKGKKIKHAGPSTPVEILGFSDVAEGGDLFYVVDNEKKAKMVVEQRIHKLKSEKQKNKGQIVSLDDLFTQIQKGQVKDLNIIIKADVQGSAEAMKQSLEKLSTPDIRVRTVHSGVGVINESDVMLASASKAIIIGFNVRVDTSTSDSATSQGVEIRLYRVIYQAIEDVQSALEGMLDPEYKEVVQGHACIRQVFKVSGIGSIAGCYVEDGKIIRNASVRLIRDGVVVYEGEINSLKRFKNDAKEVLTGYECGIGIEKFNDIKEGDIIECFTIEAVEKKL